MTYTIEIIVEIPRDEFISKLNNVDNLKHWHQGLVSAEHISGHPGDLGAKMKLNYDFGKRKMQLMETLTKINLPSELHASYKTKGMNNLQENYFERTSEGYTKWICKNQFIPLNLIMHLFTIFMPKAFKKQTRKYMQDFKNFAENRISVANAKT